MADLDDTLPADGRAVVKANERAFKTSVKNRIGSMPESWADFAGQLLVVKAGGSGPGVPDGVISGANRPFYQVLPREVFIRSSTVLNTNTHAAAVLICNSASAVTLTLSRGASPVSSLQSPVSFTIVRDASAGSVTLAVDATLVVSSNTHRRVAAGGVVGVLIVSPNVVYLKGDTEV
jgi:hypothetical protein